MLHRNTVGLFGTCGSDTWREAVMTALEAAGIGYFNPVVPDWTPECAQAEADHLANDEVILLAVTGGTEAFGALAETGWAARSAEQKGQCFFLVVEDFPDGDPKSAANRARKLVRAHAQKAGVQIFGSVAEATEAIIALLTK